MKNKLKTKDLIYAGAFAAVYLVVVLGFVPFLYLFVSTFAVGVVGATIYLMYVMKVKKFGAILILATLFGLMTSTGGHPYSIIFAIPLGIIADCIAKTGKYESKKMNSLSFIVLIGLYLDEWKPLKWKYIALVIALLIEQLLSFLEQSVAVMFILICIVCIKLYFPMVMSFLVVYKTTTISEFMAAFSKMKLPATFVIPFAVMFRFLPTVQEEWDGIRQAMGFRGIGMRFKTVFWHPIETIEYVIVPLLFSCVNVMDELVAASLARGLDSSKQRTCMAQVKFTGLDYLLVLGLCLLMVYGFTL